MKKTILIILIFIVSFNSCKKSDPVNKTTLPVAPTNLIGKVISSTAVNLSWSDNSTNETGFKIERKTGTETYKNIGTVGINVETYNDTGLISNTTYNYRVYAFNSAGVSITYSNEVTVTTDSLIHAPTVTTTPASLITSNTAVSGGTVNSDGGTSVTSRGVVWSTTENPTIALSTKTSDSNGMGTFVSSITGLAVNTTYYVKAYATNSIGTSYGAQDSFKTVNFLLPTFSDSLIEIWAGPNSNNSAEVYVPSLISDGGAAITAKGVVWSTSANPDITLSTKTSNGTGTIRFLSNITGLTANTSYYVRAYATNSVGTSYSKQVSYKTSNFLLPTLSVTNYAIDTFVTSNSATVEINPLISDGGTPIIARGVVWSTIPNPTISLSTKISLGTGNGMLTGSITGLASKVTYYIIEYATNSVGTVYGNQQSFVTGANQQNAVIGDYYGGGIVFYILKPGDVGYDANNRHGLIAAESNFIDPNIIWGDTVSTKAIGTSIGTGKSNTDLITAKLGNGYSYAALDATQISFYIGDDWYLPSKDELNQMYLNIGQGLTGIYWSSSEVDKYSAYCQDFGNGNQSSQTKFMGYYVRAIRSF